MKRILVTGTSGYIGNHLLPMVKEHYEGADIITCDVRAGQDFKNIMGYGFDIVFHLGAISTIMDSFELADKMMEVNALNLIPFFQNNDIGRFVFSSTGAIYGNRERPVREDEANWTGCISPYAQTKYVAEGIIRRMCPNHTITRFGNVYGANNDPRVEMLAITHFKKDNPIVLHGGGQTRDFIHVNEVCKAWIRAADKGINGTFNLANGQPVLIKDLAEMYSTERGVPIVYKEHRKGDVVYVVLDVTKARRAGLLPPEPFVNDYRS